MHHHLVALGLLRRDGFVREELLGVSERAALLEQAIKRVSENRMDSVSELRLNQAELLMVYTMVNISSCVSGHDGIQVLMPVFTWSFWMATPENKWDKPFILLRRTFEVADPAFEALRIKAMVHDGADIYLNGVHIARILKGEEPRIGKSKPA